MSVHLVLLFALFAPIDAHEEPPTWKTLRQEYLLDIGRYQGTATIAVESPRPQYGDTVIIVSHFKNTSDQPLAFFDPKWRILTPVRSHKLMLYDSQGDYLCDLLGNSNQTINIFVHPNHWCVVKAGETISYRITHEDGWVMTGKYPPSQLPPGKYYVQMVYLDYFISPSPFDTAIDSCCTIYTLDWRVHWANAKYVSHKETVEASVRWGALVDGHEVCRSNIVELVILPRPVVAPLP